MRQHLPQELQPDDSQASAGAVHVNMSDDFLVVLAATQDQTED